MNDNILSALKSINAATLTYTEWLNVGMALKEEGYPCSVWDDWSRSDNRYHSGECQRKWDGFGGSDNPIAGGTIIQLARDNGWIMPVRDADDGCLDWNDEIWYDGDDGFNGFEPHDTWDPVQELITYLETLFEPDDKVGYVTGDVWEDTSHRWYPSKGVYDRTAGELIASLKKHPDDIGATVGDWKREAGAWIRFNALDGEGVKNDNVVSYKYALVESDTLSITDQDAMYRKLELPIATLVYSGGKSLHAIVHIDATDYSEYRRRVDFLYDFLERNGLPVDRQNRNPSRLSRMPGVTRGNNRQYLAGVNIGRKSWSDWMDFAEGVSDELPDFEFPGQMIDDRPPLAPELISGLLRVGHKMIVSGASKSAKSFFLMELGISISEGRDFLGFPCRQGRVLYINLEIDRASCDNRIFAIYDAYGITRPRDGAFCVWNLRGHAMPLDKLVPKIIRRTRDQNFQAIIIDPIYKVITGDENSASDMGAFCNQFDRICESVGCSVIYAHHHSKGAQGGKIAQDRSSGSGVFARDPDAMIDLVELDLSEETLLKTADSPTDSAWQMEFIVRDFPQPRPQKIWFRYPLHEPDQTGTLDHEYSRGDPRRNLKQNRDGTAKSQDEKDDILLAAFEAVSMGRDEVHIMELAEYLTDDPDEKKIESKRVQIHGWLKNSKVLQKDENEKKKGVVKRRD